HLSHADDERRARRLLSARVGGEGADDLPGLGDDRQRGPPAALPAPRRPHLGLWSQRTAGPRPNRRLHRADQITGAAPARAYGRIAIRPYPPYQGGSGCRTTASPTGAA